MERGRTIGQEQQKYETRFISLNVVSGHIDIIHMLKLAINYRINCRCVVHQLESNC